MSRAAVSWAVVVSALILARIGFPHASTDVASVRLECGPVAVGLQCRLLALSLDVSKTPRDVTADAEWRLSGPAGARVSPGGIVRARADGDVAIGAAFEGHRARAFARLARDRTGELLATVEGTVYVEAGAALRAIPRARVDIVSGPSSGRSTFADDDGHYEFLAVAPGETVIAAARHGFTAGRQSAHLYAGDNHFSLLLEFARGAVSGVGAQAIGS